MDGAPGRQPREAALDGLGDLVAGAAAEQRPEAKVEAEVLVGGADEVEHGEHGFMG